MNDPRSGEPGSGAVGRAAARGVAWTFAATAASRLLWIAALAVLARLLAPRDFGLLASALVFLTYAETVADLGTGAALIYWPERREEAAEVTFRIHVAMGVLGFALAQLLAPFVADFFGNPASAPVLRALAWSFPLKYLGTTHDALAQKDLRFRARLVPEVGLAATKALVAVGLAWAGLGVWALVWGQLAGQAVWTLLLWLVVPWRPSRRWPRGLVRPMVAYGRGIVAVNALAAVTHHADLVIVGRTLGTATLGFYQMAAKVPETTVTVLGWVVSRVLFPAFSKLHAAGEAMGEAYLAALRWVSLLTVPATVGVALTARPLVLNLFGEPWLPAVPILQAIAVYAGLRSLGTHAGDVLKATGRSGLLAGLGVLKAALLVPALVLASRHGAAAVAAALAGVTAATLLLNWGVICRLAPLRPRALLAALRPSLLAGAALAAFLLVWERLVLRPDALVAWLGAVALGGAIYLLALRLVAPETWEAGRRALGGGRAARLAEPGWEARG
ncbi:MAG TPA: lipopolysaccharide biosynthesis protein [Thermoanaerobaculia bacterium]|nr:lipopolysaccharide biosynthesis protein [Thermoanaerobaculia bacterium]